MFIFNGARLGERPDFSDRGEPPSGRSTQQCHLRGWWLHRRFSYEPCVRPRSGCNDLEGDRVNAHTRARGAARGGTLPVCHRRPGGSTQIAQVERYDSAFNSWTDLTEMPRPQPCRRLRRWSLACVAGGREPATSNAVDCLDTTTTTWRTGTPLPIPTSGAAAGLVNGVLTVAGGESSGETALVPLIQELTGKFVEHTINEYPTPRDWLRGLIAAGSGCAAARPHPATTQAPPARPSLQ